MTSMIKIVIIRFNCRLPVPYLKEDIKELASGACMKMISGTRKSRSFTSKALMAGRAKAKAAKAIIQMKGEVTLSRNW